MARGGSGKFSLKQLWNFILTKANIIKIDQIEENTAAQPGARILYHGTGDNADDTVDAGYVYYLSGSDNWVKVDFTSYAASGGGKLLGFTLGTPKDAASWYAGTGGNIIPAKGGILLRGQARAHVWGNSTAGPFVGSPVYGIRHVAFPGHMIYSPPTQSDLLFPAKQEVEKPLGIVLKIIDDEFAPFLRHVLLDFNPDHSFNTTPQEASLRYSVASDQGASSATISGLEIARGVIRGEPSGDVNWTTESKTDIQAVLNMSIGNSMLQFSIINEATDGTSDITLVAGTGMYGITGSAVIKARDTADDANSSGSALFGLHLRANATDMEILRLA